VCVNIPTQAVPLKHAYYSHHKCATGWSNSILRELCFHLGLRHKTAHGAQQYGSHGGLRSWVGVHRVEFLAFTNAKIEQANSLPPHRGFHVVRDPRDVLVSAYFSHKNSHPTKDWPELEEHRKALQSLSKEEGLLKEIEFSRQFLEPMQNWDYDQDHILEVKMEELTGDPGQKFREILSHLELLGEQGESPGAVSKLRQYGNRGFYKLHHEISLPLPRRLSVEDAIHPDVLDAILHAHRFEKMAGGRAKGEENTKSHYRKGKPGDWQNHFTDAVERAFKNSYGDIVSKLGYAKS